MDNKSARRRQLLETLGVLILCNMSTRDQGIVMDSMTTRCVQQWCNKTGGESMTDLKTDSGDYGPKHLDTGVLVVFCFD
ncbi:hypothetical protein PIB30_023249 [Stylosanthes scabra]|uniref:Uncharacterized protein n=1 Tax=Stylosanthes scabra TaxID=79078 RepID=A0ABU6Y7L3_9FABA|nr:hypothetical protein [Stylosanthes scabra]